MTVVSEGGEHRGLALSLTHKAEPRIVRVRKKGLLAITSPMWCRVALLDLVLRISASMSAICLLYSTMAFRAALHFVK